MNEVNDILVIEKSDEILEDTNESPACNDTLNCFMIFILFRLPKTRDLAGICDCLVNLLVLLRMFVTNIDVLRAAYYEFILQVVQ